MAEATPRPTKDGVEGAKAIAPEKKRVMVAMASFIVLIVGVENDEGEVVLQ